MTITSLGPRCTPWIEETRSQRVDFLPLELTKTKGYNDYLNSLGASLKSSPSAREVTSQTKPET